MSTSGSSGPFGRSRPDRPSTSYSNASTSRQTMRNDSPARTYQNIARPSTSWSTASTSQQLTRPPTAYSTRTTSTSYQNSCAISSTPYGTQQSTARPGTTTGRRSRAPSALSVGESQKIICALSEARGVTPTVGLAFINLSTGEAVLSQICDTQFYIRTINKLQVFDPTEILIVSTNAPPNQKSKMYLIIEENIPGVKIHPVDRKYWSEVAGLEYISQLSFAEDVDTVKISIGGNYFATCCFAAAMKHVDLKWNLTFAPHSLRIKYQSSEGTMLIDLSTVQSLELIQNIQNAKSKDSLFGLMNQTTTPMGARLLRSSILQPTTDEDVLLQRHKAIAELTTKEDMFSQIRHVLNSILDIEKLLSSLIIVPRVVNMEHMEQSINKILMLKQFLQSITPLFEAMVGARSYLLVQIQDHCRNENIAGTMNLIQEVINDDVTFESKPLDLRNQRTYAVRSGVSGLLDVARQTFKEATEDVHQHVSSLNQEFEIQAETKYENARKYYLSIPESEFNGKPIPNVLVNRYRKKGCIECQTIELMKLNQRIEDSHQEVILMSDQTIQTLLISIHGEISTLFRICEGVALLDMLAGFCHLATSGEEYVQPEIAERIAIKSGRHPIHKSEKFVPNDVFATQMERFQIITGCNMSGKSTYIRSVALMSIMVQVGSFVPASYASFPIIHQIFARVSMDDCIEANVSSFAAEMRETAFILRNIDKRSLAIIDELGRGTSTRDGLAIALSIAEVLVDSRAIVFFATHFRELAQILHQRDGVVNMHFAVEMKDDKMAMLYQIDDGFLQEAHYGIALARVVNLPPQVLEVAESVSRALEDQIAQKKKSSKGSALAQRRKVLLALKDQLQELAKGPMNGESLRAYMKKLQAEFVERMEAIEELERGSDHDEGSVVEGESGGEEEGSGEDDGWGDGSSSLSGSMLV